MLVLTYHAVAAGRSRSPLSVEPALFAEHLDCLAGTATFLTVSELGVRLTAGTLPDRAVAITFDDGLRSVATDAAPLLVERGLPATVFCVSGRLGSDSSWPSAPAGAPSAPLLSAAELAELADAGFEIGSHGMHHAPLVGGSEWLLRKEIADSRLVLEQAVGVQVTSFAYPYGAGPSPTAARLVASTYAAACTTVLAEVRPGSDVHALPRVDAHYLRRPALLRRAVRGSLDNYLRVRALGAGARRRLVKDYA